MKARVGWAINLQVMLLLGLPFVANAQFIHTTNNGTITITGYSGPGGAVNIPETINGLPVVAIGTNAFYNRTSLTSVTIPFGIIDIGAFAFTSCENLTNVTLPNSVTRVRDYAFYGCTSLTNVVIPSSVTNIGSRPFTYCYRMTVITVDALNPVFSSVDGVLFDKNQTTLLQYPGGSDRSYAIPYGVVTIGSHAFESCILLTNIVIPNSVLNIRSNAFDSCYSLMGITIPGSVINIEECAFRYTAMTSVTIPDGVVTISRDLFSGCLALTNVVIPNSVTNIGELAFSSCTSLASVTLPDSVTHLGGYAFAQCSSLVSIKIPSNTTHIGRSAFQQCSALTNITIPDGVINIESAAFYYCLRLATVKIGNGVTNIGDRALMSCGSLTNLSIPDNLVNIGDQAFDYCYSLSSITIPDSVVNVGDSVFNSCVNLTNVTIGSGTTRIGENAFSGCTRLTAINVDANNSSFSSVAGVLFNKNQTTILQYPKGKAGSYTIPDSVTTIGNTAFVSCVGLTKVTIGNGITSLSNSTFYGAFYNCSQLSAVVIPETVTYLGSPFYGCALSEVYFKGNPPSSGFTSFYGSGYPTIYYLPGTVGWETTFAGRPTVLWNPAVLTDDAHFGIRTNRFGFTITGSSNLVIVVEASTNLDGSSFWSPAGTNTLTGGSSYFSDLQWTNYPSRFYRIKSPWR